MTDPATERFADLMIQLVNAGKHPSKAELAVLAVESGFSVREALYQIASMGKFHRVDIEGLRALDEFMKSLYADSSDEEVLEYLASPRALSAAILENNQSISTHFITPDVHLPELLTVLFRDALIAKSAEDIETEKVFDCIVCQPPLGIRTARDGAVAFGGEVLTALAARLSDKGRLFWLTSRGDMMEAKQRGTFTALQTRGLNLVAELEVPSGGFLGTAIEAVLLIFESRFTSRKLVGAIRDLAVAPSIAAALTRGPSKNAGAGWIWLENDDERTYSNIEREQLLKRLTPRGQHTKTPFGEIISDEAISKADEPLSDSNSAIGYLYFPEYAGSRVTAELEEQTVKPRAVYRVPIDTSKANPRFLATLFNSVFGRELREMAASGSTIRRVKVPDLHGIEIPLPPLKIQEQIVRVEGDLSLLSNGFEEIRDNLGSDWTVLDEISERVNNLKAVLDIDQQIENWWRELPYPLAAIYRRYQVSSDPKERLDRLLHFFEMAAIYLAAIGTSHVKALRHDWQEHFAKWFHPASTAGIERTDFGFWTMLAGASLKDLNRIASTPELREAASDRSGIELVEAAASLGALGKTTEILDNARRYRNSWKGHGGHQKASDAAQLDAELQQTIRDFYEATSRIFRRLFLVRPGLAEVTDTGFAYEIDILAGSDPAFEKENVELGRPAKTHALAFWMKGSRQMCRALPFFRLGAPQEPQETSFYVFNRVESEGFRWISYQEAREQEFVAPDDELHSLIEIRRDSSA
jgi:hypothetical protein